MLASAHLESVLAQAHLYEASLVIRAILVEYAAYACRSFNILSHHVEIATATCARQLVAEAEVVNLFCECFHSGRVGAGIEQLVLLPCLANEASHALEVEALYGVEHLQCVCLRRAR